MVSPLGVEVIMDPCGTCLGIGTVKVQNTINVKARLSPGYGGTPTPPGSPNARSRLGSTMG